MQKQVHCGKDRINVIENARYEEVKAWNYKCALKDPWIYKPECENLLKILGNI